MNVALDVESVRYDRHRRLLQSEVSQSVVPLWKHILNLEGQNDTSRASELVEVGARMCRKCFTAYERCTKQITSLRKSISKVVVLLNDNSESDDSDSSAETRPPPPKRLAIHVGPSNASPDVTVMHIIKLTNILNLFLDCRCKLITEKSPEII